MANFENRWLYEAGIGENRAMLVRGGACIIARIERENDTHVEAGAVVDAVFASQWVRGVSGIATLKSGEQCLLQPLTPGLSEGQAVRIEITRAGFAERGGQVKRAKAKPANADAELCSAPDLLAAIIRQASAQDIEVRQVQPHEPDVMAEYGWHDVMEQAVSGLVPFDGGTLIISPTPAMTMIDIDGPLDAFTLSSRAARAAAMAMGRLDLSGPVGIDFPSLSEKKQRTEICAIFDAAMASGPAMRCERTAINGFGFMQVVSRRTRASLCEIMQADAPLNVALELLRRAQRGCGTGELTIAAHPAVAVKLEQRPSWLDMLARQTGRSVSVASDGALALHSGQIIGD